MKLYRYSEVSKRVEESEAVLIDKPVDGPLSAFIPYGPNVYQVTMHATVETTTLGWLLFRWDRTPLGALDKHMKREQEEAAKHLGNVALLRTLRKDMLSAGT